MYAEFPCEPDGKLPVSEKSEGDPYVRTDRGQFFAKLQLIWTSSAKRLRWLPAHFGLCDHLVLRCVQMIQVVLGHAQPASRTQPGRA